MPRRHYHHRATFKSATRRSRSSVAPTSPGAFVIVLVVVVLAVGAILLLPLITASNNAMNQSYTAKGNNYTPYVVPTTNYSGMTLCGDGTYSSSTGSGTCSHHKGIK